MSDFDSPWKEALDLYFPAFMAFFFPQAHREIDWSRGHEALDKELQQLVKVWRTGGEEAWILIHVEVQSQEDPEFPQRMYVYNYRLYDCYNRVVVSLAVLGDDRPGWRPDHFGYSLWGCEASLRYPVVKLLDYAGVTEALETSTNPFATVVLAHLKTRETRQDPVARQAWKFRLVKGLYAKNFSKEDVRQLFRFIDWMMDLPEVLERSFQQELYSYEKEDRMPFITSVERAGIAKGLLKGIEAMLRMKFGEAGLSVLPALQDVWNIELLERVLSKLETAQSLQEVQQILPGSTAK